MKLSLTFVQLLLFMGSVSSRMLQSTHRKLDVLGYDSLAIPESYIFVFADNITATSKDSLIYDIKMSGGTITYEYYDSFYGIAAEGITDALLDKILDHPDVSRVMPDSTNTFRSIVDMNPKNWGIDRIDQERLPLNSMYQSNYTGAGINIYLIDSGINLNHTEFIGSNVSCGFDATNESLYPCQDANGHGTMLAGLAGGNVSGVARGANLIAVKIGHKEPTTAQTIAGCDFVTAQKRLYRSQPMVAVIASGPSYVDTLLNEAVERLITAGVFVAVASGNDSNDACLTSPGNVARACTVGATTVFDQLENETSFGPCVDIFAPAYGLLSPWKKSTQYVLVSGTSPASGLVGGVAALHLEKNPTLKPFQVYLNMRNDAVRDILVGPFANSTLKFPRMWFWQTKTKNLLLNIGPSLSLDGIDTDMI